MTQSKTSDEKKQITKKAIELWISGSSAKDIGLMDLVVLEELIAQEKEAEDQTPEL